MLRALFFSAATVATLSTAAASLLDSSFDPGTGAGGGLVEQVLPVAGGKILICGNFTSFNRHDKAYLARLNSDGSVDDTFHARPGYWVRNVSAQPDGKLIIGGFFTTVAGVTRDLIARLNTDGSLDTTFNPGAGARDIIAGGIDGNITPFVFWTAVQPDGKILITGNFRNYNGASSVGLARLNPDGSRDTSFNIGGGLNSWGRHLNVLPNGQILVSGWFSEYRGQSFNRLARINPDGSPDTSFKPFFGDRTAIYVTALTDDGKIIAAGHSLNEEGLFHREMARLNPDGTIDASFLGYTNEKTESAVIQPDGKVIVGGYFTRANGVPRRMLARFNPDGTLDPDFSADIDNFIWSVALQADGKLLIGGAFNTVDGVSRVGIARLHTGLTNGGGHPPAQDPAPLLAVSSATTNSITLAWTDRSTNRAGYDLEMHAGSAYDTLATLSSDSRAFTVNGLGASRQYIFRLKGTNSLGEATYSREIAGLTAAISNGAPGAATFIGSDRTTGGTWIGNYGGDGFSVAGDRALLPAYVSLTPIASSEWIWNDATDQTRALQRATVTNRLAACWYSEAGFALDLNFKDDQPRRAAIYFLDWDRSGRMQEVRVTDSTTGALLDSRSLAAFDQGTYLIWNLAGQVRITVSAQFGNSIASGIFFGPAGPVSGPLGPDLVLSARLADQRLTLTFNPPRPGDYRILSTRDLTSSDWQTAALLTNLTASAIWTDTNTTAPARFYRVTTAE